LENEIMSKLFSALVLFAASFPALAVGQPLPEPGTMALVALGVAGVALFAKRKK
jgi:PEP-CTERM motif